MTDPLAPVGDGHTEVPDEVRDQLIPTYIATLSELYEAEADNVANATIGRSPSVEDLLDEIYLRDLHRVMFDQVWRWAGRYRQHNVNIGNVDCQELPVFVRDLVEDTLVWVSAGTFPRDEIAIRFHHRLVQIHPFANGNGRHGRFVAEFLIEGLGRPRFTWGAALGAERKELRARYRHALQKMDRDSEDVAELLAFARG